LQNYTFLDYFLLQNYTFLDYFSLHKKCTKCFKEDISQFRNKRMTYFPDSAMISE
jgi:hypothetical protein